MLEGFIFMKSDTIASDGLSKVKKNLIHILYNNDTSICNVWLREPNLSDPFLRWRNTQTQRFF